jgi:hypothetical protein
MDISVKKKERMRSDQLSARPGRREDAKVIHDSI